MDVSGLVRVFEASPLDAARMSTGLARHFFTSRHVLSVTSECSGGNVAGVDVVAHDDYITTQVVMPDQFREWSIQHNRPLPPVQAITLPVWRQGLLAAFHTEGEPLERLIRPFVGGDLVAWTVALGPTMGTYAVMVSGTRSSRSAARPRRRSVEVHFVTAEERFEAVYTEGWMVGSRLYGHPKIPRDLQARLRPTDVVAVEVAGSGKEPIVLLPNLEADAPMLPLVAADNEMEALRQQAPQIVEAVERKYCARVDLDSLLTVTRTAMMLANDENWLNEIEQAYSKHPASMVDRAVLAAAWLFNVDDLAEPE